MAAGTTPSALTNTGYFGNVILGEDDKIYFPDNHIIRRLMPDGQLDNSYVFTG